MFLAPIQANHCAEHRLQFSLYCENSAREKRALPYPPSHLQLFDEMTDDNGVTNAFLFTNLAILVNAKAMVDKF